MERRGFLGTLAAAITAPEIATVEGEQKGRIEVPEPLTHMATFEIKPNSIVVLTCPGRISFETRMRLEELAKSHLPPDVRVMVLSEGIQMAVGTIVEE